MSERLARCSTDAACPRRWADGGPDRPCGGHYGDEGGLAERMKTLGITAVPGRETTTTEDEQAQDSARTLTDHEPSKTSRTINH